MKNIRIFYLKIFFVLVVKFSVYLNRCVFVILVRISAVLTSTHNLCFEQKYEKYQNFLSENFQFLVVKFSIYLNRRVFVMEGLLVTIV